MRIPHPAQHPRKDFRSAGVRVLKKISEKNDVSLAKAIEERALLRYGNPAKPLQTEAVVNLVRGKNTFLLAGTGFGKLRIPEMFYELIPKHTGAVILVLNPLDSLGNNQVSEKVAAGFTAINLTKLTFNPCEASKIRTGVYQFVYLSPEIFLNSKLWDSVYFSNEFQNRLALVVADEAHMIYQWGIVESSKAKKAKHGAACGESDPNQFEARFVKYDDVERRTHSSQTPDNRVVPTLIYSGSKRRTGQVLNVLAGAREAENLVLSATSPFARRFHSCTGESDKERCVKDFANSKFPVFSCTMALGLGQNWSWVRSAICMGRGEPSAISQMIGQCGRDGRPGLAILYVEKTRKNGKNQVKQFGGGYQNEPSDDNRMDALAITPVCLRIALAIDNQLGYIPLTSTNSAYLEEKTREVDAGFPLCRCSNCLPEDAKALMAHIKQIDQDNFDAMVLHPVALESPDPLVKNKSSRTQPERYPINPDSLAAFRVNLNEQVHTFLSTQLYEYSLVGPNDIFGPKQVGQITLNLTNLASPQQVRETIGGEFTVGLSQCVYDCISAFKNSLIYLNHLDWVKQQEYDAQLIKTPNYKLTPKQIICKKELKAALALQKEKDKQEAEAECEALDVHMSDESSEGSDLESSPSFSPSASLE
ncbi:hypothetical protein PCANC_11665 [Puccinia coronata f. sp. avenae]|uniref:DNA 3'-5' helicase n=1 Tax=Puccinia coronata f. sp. avenae TaxID=200324 RepID=A0A2N5VXF4_9BASI|nr:hypothetical protein PCANC_11665 [Puccinia coronata f. sp. avenae]